MTHAWQARHRLQSRTEYQAEFNNLFNPGFRLIDVSGYGVNGVDHYATVWE
jgi:Bacterial tandem repeat domain 1